MRTLIFATLLLSTTSQLHAETTDTSQVPSYFRKYLDCVPKDVEIADVRQLKRHGWRQDKVDGQARAVEVTDTLNVVIRMRPISPFANLRFEQLSSDTFAWAKQSMIGWIRDTARAGGVELEDAKISTPGWEMYSVVLPDLNGNILGATVLVSDADREIVQFFYPRSAEYKGIEVFRVARGYFIRNLARCVISPKPAGNEN